MFTCMRMTLQHERNRAITAQWTEKGSRPKSTKVTCRDALELDHNRCCEDRRT